MYLLTNNLDPDPTKGALLKAGLELLAEKGYKGATTREIALKAGVSEVTLFRHYKNKQALLREAINRIAPPVEQFLPAPSDHIEADLLALVQAISHFIEANKGLVVRLLPELLRHPELRGEGPASGFANTFAEAGRYFRRCQEMGLLRPDESPQAMVVAFIGPLITKVLLGGVWGLEMTFDYRAYVRSFLEGRRTHGKR